ncbi:MAG: T9SS type A sorting domain-containing protein [Bacteroidales bacterium]|nr:T9SS type A sorting domain-containing protein [Bacteroidales bacterium]
MRAIYVIVLIFLMPIAIVAQEKPPETTDDYASILAGDTISVNVLLNDWGMEGHTIEIFFAWNSEVGEVSYTDSIISYYSYYYYMGLDSVRYILKDLDNGLLSEYGYLYIDVSNYGRDYLNVNNISAVMNAFGYQFNTLPEFDTGFEVPVGSRANSIFAFTLWMGGMDENDELHLAGERYRQIGVDYYVGPCGDSYENQQMIDYNKVWKFNREELENHKQNWWKPNYEAIDNIISWPAHGNAQFGQDYHLAPFIDHDEDGNYDPLSGDVPAIRGDQGVFMIYNDDLYAHEETGGQKIGVEVHATAYGYDCPQDSIFNNSIFFHYDIINRSDTAYHDFFISGFVDLDLGNPWDDFIGCDTSLNSFFAYNGDNYDENSTLWNPDTAFGYLNYPPAQGFTYLNHDMSSFIGLLYTGGSMSDPHFAEEYYYIMNGLWKDSTSVTYGGNGYGGDIPVKYQYPGDPNNPLEWSEVSAEIDPGDRRGIGTIGPFDFNPDDTIQLDLAFVFARDYEGDHLSSVTLLKERIEQLQWYYDNDSTPCGETWSGTQKQIDSDQIFSIFPNPVRGKLFVKTSYTPEDLRYEIYNSIGQLVQKGYVGNKNNSIEVNNLKKGFYLISVKTIDEYITKKFIKY